MLNNDTSLGPVVVIEPSCVRDAHQLKVEAVRLRDLFLREALRLDKRPGSTSFEQVATLSFNYENLTSIATLLHQLANLRPTAKKQD